MTINQHIFGYHIFRQIHVIIYIYMISREYHDRSPSTQGYLGCYISPFDASPRPQSASLRSRPTPSTRRADRVGEVGHVGSKSGENHMRKSFSGETLLAQGKKQGLRTCWPALGARLLQRASAFERFGFLVKNAGSVKQFCDHWRFLLTEGLVYFPKSSVHKGCAENCLDSRLIPP